MGCVVSKDPDEVDAFPKIVFDKFFEFFGVDEGGKVVLIGGDEGCVD